MAIHYDAVSHVVKRSAQALEHHPLLQDPDRPQMPDISKASVVIVFLTIAVFAVGITLIRYTLWNVVGTLALVEQPQTTVVINGYKDDNNPAEPDEAIVLNEKPITSNIRATIRHLHRKAGWRSRYRGMSLAIVRGIVGSLLGELILAIISRPSLSQSVNAIIGWRVLSQLIATVVTSLALLQWSVAWTHIVVSEPSSKPWYRRIPPVSTFRQVALPTLAHDVASALNFIVPVIIAAHTMPSVFDEEPHTPAEAARLARRILGSLSLAFLVGLVMAVLVTLPCFIVMTRIYASLLPSEHEAIVPFDRTFGGKAIPKDLGGSGVLSWRDAVRTLDAEFRCRLLKLYSKFILIDIGLHLFMGLCIFLQVYFLFGSHIKTLLVYVQDQQQAGQL